MEKDGFFKSIPGKKICNNFNIFILESWRNKMLIPLSKPHISKQVYDTVSRVLSSGKLSGNGDICHETEKNLRKKLHIEHVLLTSSCTHALEISTLLLDAKQNDEVILPSFTFASTANAILIAGLQPVFCEIDPRTMNLDVNHVARKISKKTKAVIPVHYAGVACEMDALLSLCQDNNIIVIEDAAHAIGAKWQGKSLGTLGDMGTFSFHDTKNVTCGEGGAFVTKNEFFANQAQILREKGTNRIQFLKGQVDKYTWIKRGSSYVLAEPLAAILSVQVDMMEELNKKRIEVYQYYIKEFSSLEKKEILQLPFIPEGCQSNAHLFHLFLRNTKERDSLMSFLRSKGIGASFHYVPLHSAPLGQKLGYKHNDFPLTEEYSSKLLRLPLYPDLHRSDLERVVTEVFNWAQMM
jgi:dTDP-4-amino-4,6-dideoxygalactose transaminase